MIYDEALREYATFGGPVRNLSQKAETPDEARLRHVAGTAWSTKRYLNMELLKDQHMKGAVTA
jgi:hypothetical protein